MGWRAPDELDNRGRTSHGKGPPPAGLVNRAIANIGIGVLYAIAREVQALNILGWSHKPALSQTAHPNAKIDAIARHCHYHTAVRHIGTRQGNCLGCCHRGSKVEMIIVGDEA